MNEDTTTKHGAGGVPYLHHMNVRNNSHTNKCGEKDQLRPSYVHPCACLHILNCFVRIPATKQRVSLAVACEAYSTSSHSDIKINHPRLVTRSTVSGVLDCNPKSSHHSQSTHSMHLFGVKITN